jgi:hypothetical protein
MAFEGGWKWACQMARDDKGEPLPALGADVNATAKLCKYLADVRNPFPLSNEMAGGFLGKGWSEGKDALLTLVEIGLLVVTQKANHAAGLATRYRHRPSPLQGPAEDFFGCACRMVQRYPVGLAANYGKLASFAFHLFALLGGRPIGLPKEKLAMWVGVTPQTVDATVKRLEADGLLKRAPGGWLYCGRHGPLQPA